MPAADLLRDYELLLVRKHRFALADIVVCMQRVVQDLQQLQRSLAVAWASSTDSDKNSADTLDRISSRLQRAVSLVPSFLGKRSSEHSCRRCKSCVDCRRVWRRVSLLASRRSNRR